MGNTLPILAITVDGCTVPNPGKMRVAAILELVDSLEEYLQGNGRIICVSSKNLGWGTNNLCEYQAIIHALGELNYIRRVYSRVVVVSDSKLAVNQILGTYKTNNKKLLTARKMVQEYIKDIADFKIVWQPRTNPRLVEVDLLSKGGEAAEALATQLVSGRRKNE